MNCGYDREVKAAEWAAVLDGADTETLLKAYTAKFHSNNGCFNCATRHYRALSKPQQDSLAEALGVA